MNALVSRLPWKYRDTKNRGVFGDGNAQVVGFRGGTIAEVWSGVEGKQEVADANANFIVKACNNHEDLVNYLKRFVAIAENGGGDAYEVSTVLHEAKKVLRRIERQSQ